MSGAPAALHALLTHQTPTACICAQLERHLAGGDADGRGWTTEVAQSAVAGAGEGVFLRGSCAAGTVLAVYGGVVFAPEDLAMMHKQILTGNGYVLARRDGVLIDGRPDSVSRQLFEMAVQRDRAAGVAPLVTTELCVGHKVNHPPRGAAPNVSVHPLDLRKEEHPALHRFLPTVNFRPPAGGAPAKQSAVLVASRRIADEELLLDYKLRPEGPLEPWYHAVGAALPAPCDNLHISSREPAA